MYTGLVLIGYVSSVAAVLFCAAMIFLLVKKGDPARSRHSRAALLFTGLLCAFCILYFYFYYQDSFLHNYRVPAVLRALDYLLDGGILAAWYYLLGVLAEKGKRQILPGAALIFCLRGILFGDAAVFVMDSYYRIHMGSGAWSLAEGAVTAVTVMLLLRQIVCVWKQDIPRLQREYTLSVTILLLFADVWTWFIDRALYTGVQISFWQVEFFDITGPVILAVSAITFLYLFRTDFTRAFLEREPEEDPLEYMAAVWGLTQREREVAVLLYQGMDNAAIGEALHISRNTVKKHTQNIYGKAQVKSRIELAGKINQQRRG
ncbi:MAG: helix-turn-helix transcriptional regulator [Eubacteriales bacterium]|nr:helix-turn-helix transcriptional regulator [Eubacteriales bacterium]